MKAVITFAAVLLFPTLLSAQDTIPPADRCAAGSTSPYLRCALWQDGHRVRRGTEGAVVGEPGFFSPIPLARLVQGDSAQAHARVFQRQSRRAITFGVISGLFAGGAIIVARSYECNPEPTFGFCTTRDDEYGMAAGGLALGAVATAIVTGLYQRSATRALQRALLWHNATFAR